MDKKLQLEQAKMDVAAIDAIDEAQNHMKDVGVEKYSEKVEDLILDTQETKMQQQEINDRLKDLVENDEEEEEIDVSYLLTLGHDERVDGRNQHRKEEKDRSRQERKRQHSPNQHPKKQESGGGRRHRKNDGVTWLICFKKITHLNIIFLSTPAYTQQKADSICFQVGST